MLRPDTFALTALLAVLMAIGPLSVDLYLPSLPDIGRALDATTADVQLTISSYLIGFAVGQIVYGPVSDIFGRKKILLGALVIFCLATLACACAPSITVLIAARVVQALGSSGAIVLARAVVRDLYSGPRAGRELALMGMIMGIAPIGAPMIGGVLETAFGWQACFLFVFAGGVMAFCAVWWLLPETLRHKQSARLEIAELVGAYGLVARDRGFLAHSALVSSSFAGLFAFISGASFVLQDFFALTPIGFSLAFAAASAGNIIGASLAAKFVMRAGLDRTIGAGALAQCVGGAGTLVATALMPTSAVAFLVPMTLYMIGLGLAMPQALAGALQPFPRYAGTASSLVGMSQQTIAALAGAVVGQMLVATAWPLVVIVALAGGVTFLVWALTRGARAASLHRAP